MTKVLYYNTYIGLGGANKEIGSQSDARCESFETMVNIINIIPLCRMFNVYNVAMSSTIISMSAVVQN
jgi:hypothetical protein